MKWLALTAAFLGFALSAHAGQLSPTQLTEILHTDVSESLILGERNSLVPVWPVFRPVPSGHGGTPEPQLFAFLFESIDVEPVRGYSGKPINLLILMTPDGKLLNVRLIQHSEPIFGGEAGFSELAVFSKQYDDLTINHEIQIYKANSTPSRDEVTASLHGILRGTVTAIAINKSIMSAAVQVAEARLNDPNAAPAAFGPSGRNEKYERMGWNPLIDTGLLQRIELENRDLEGLFKGTAGTNQDSTAILRPSALSLDAWVAPVSLPQAGRNMLSSKGWEQVRALREEGAQVFIVQDASRYSILSSEQKKPRYAAELLLEQNGKRFPLTKVDYAHRVRLTGKGSGVSEGSEPKFFSTKPGDGFDVMQAFSAIFVVSRLRQDQAVTVDVEHVFDIPNVAQWLPVLETPQWVKVWQQRKTDIAILVGALLVLTIALIAQRQLSVSARRLSVFRTLFLIFTLGFIGWYGQGQLTIVNITSMLEAVTSGQSAEFLLADPMAVTLWAFVLVTLFVWGRGTFCGWLCPFGAFQELINKLASAFGLKQRTLRSATDAALKWVKYGVLAIILVAAVLSGTWTERFVEIEPFKTTISMTFQREWPYIAWAIACLALSLFVYRGYCKYLCPLGAALAVMGRVRLLKWIPRKAECGTPCQTCRFRCDYQAITPVGKIDYQECFQCLDCVSIHQDDQRCLPLILERKREYKPIEIKRVAA
ncbi:MAG: 4Fe-4S binding protein [Burkholderiaceae bacterium]